MARALTVSRGIRRNGELGLFLSRNIVPLSKPNDDDVVVGWGQKANTIKAERFAKKHSLPYWRIEDGFLAYLSHPARGAQRLSLIIDKTGIYYDAHRPSDLENMLNDGLWMTPELKERAVSLRERIVAAGLSKYNHAPNKLSDNRLAEIGTGPFVLVVDQTAGDVSIEAGHANSDSFQEMLSAALDENPDATILVKVHPDVLIGKKAGHFSDLDHPRCKLVADPCSPYALFDMASKVYVVTSQMGFEALLAGKDVTCFGMPFYAGWGLSDDRLVLDRRVAKPCLDTLVAAALIRYPKYRDPFLGEDSDVEHVIALLENEKALARPVGKTAWFVGFSLWKRSFIAPFIEGGVDQIRYIGPRRAVTLKPAKDDCVVLWGRRFPEVAARLKGHCSVWHMEDGFIRSVGLGSDLQRPSSLVLDSRGIYYDASDESDLEHFLANHEFSDHDREQGAKLLTSIRESKVSKYNVGSGADIDFKEAAGRRIILVTGQVEGDASLRYGAGGIDNNNSLLQAVRKANPDAFIVYKPHPDVISGNRLGVVSEEVMATAVDYLLEGTSITDCFKTIDALHVMTSQAGFEALQYGVKVTTWGCPFYAGWGLTTDMQSAPRRGRALTLEEMVYSALIIYPRYAAWPAERPATAASIVAALAHYNKAAKPGRRNVRGGLYSVGRKARNLLEAFIR